jgi:hypothetical protein
MVRVTAVYLVTTLAVLCGCRVDKVPASPRALRLDSARAVSRTTGVGRAPMFAVSPKGVEALAWISAAGGGTDGRLVISANQLPPVILGDSLGPIEAHGESPPKLVYGGDGALNAIYVVAKVVPGRRFPLAALRFTRSSDDGRTWSAPVTVTDDSVFGSHNFHALHASGDGTLYVTWLDGRAGGGKSAAYIARSTDGGKSWSRNVRIASGEACPCCRTAIATAGDGTLYVGWREVMTGNVRDIVVAKSDDKGATWSRPNRVNADDWMFDGCPHAGPSLQVDSLGRLHVAWWTGKEGSAGVYYARSDDGGATFTELESLGVAKFSRPAHVQLAVRDSLVAVTWDDGTREPSQVVSRVSRDGGTTFSPVVALSDPARLSGYPVLAMLADGFSVAWSEEDPAVAAHESHPDMKDPKATKPLTPVGSAQVMVRRATWR